MTCPQTFSGEGYRNPDEYRRVFCSYAPSGNGPAIMVDDRETSSKVVESLHALGAAISIQRLPVGDYAIGDRIIVERKTTRDFADTLVDRDLLGQVRALATSCIRPVLVIEGEDLYKERNIHPNAIRGTLSAIAIDLGVTLFTTKDAADTAAMLFVIAKREYEERGERTPSIRKPYHSQMEQQESIIGAFPEVGLKNARLLLDHFGSVQGIVNADEKALSEVPGIGEKRAKKIYEIIETPLRLRKEFQGFDTFFDRIHQGKAAVRIRFAWRSFQRV